MDQRRRIASIIKWTARISGSLLIVFVLFFLFGSIFGTEESAGEGLISAKDISAFICFPLATIIGLAMAWKWEGLGGFISTIGFIILFIIRTDLASSPEMIVLPVPGLLFLVYWIMTKKSN